MDVDCEGTGTQHSKRHDDVLLNGSEDGSSHHGNRYFTDLLHLHSQDFADCRTQNDERKVASSVWSKIAEGRKGRFLVNSSVPNKYEVLDKASAVSKVCKVISDLSSSAQRDPLLAFHQLRLLQEEVRTMKEEKQRLRRDLSLMMEDCAVFQREIISLKHSCVDLCHNFHELRDIQRSYELAMSRNAGLSSVSSQLTSNSPDESHLLAFSRTREPPLLGQQVTSRELKRKAVTAFEDQRFNS